MTDKVDADIYNLGRNGPSSGNKLSQLSTGHPLKASEENYDKRVHDMNMEMLRKYEGIHAPLQLTMEMLALKKVGRLPFLKSSNALLDSLTGRDELIDFTDSLGGEFSESLRQPYAVMEKHLDIL